MRSRIGTDLRAPGLRAPARALLPALVAASFIAISSRAWPAGGHNSKELAVGESTSIDILALKEVTVYQVLSEGDRLTLLLETDGVVQFIGVGARVDVSVTGTRGDRTVFSLSSAEHVSVWPIRRLEIRRDKGRFTLEAVAADWAFVVSVHRSRKGGLSVSCNGIPCLVDAGERLDADREGGKVVFRVIDEIWPGRLVRAEGPAPREKRVPPPPKPPRKRKARVLPPLPFVLTGWGAWEVRPPLSVSP